MDSKEEVVKKKNKCVEKRKARLTSFCAGAKPLPRLESALPRLSPKPCLGLSRSGISWLLCPGSLWSLYLSGSWLAYPGDFRLPYPSGFWLPCLGGSRSPRPGSRSPLPDGSRLPCPYQSRLSRLSSWSPHPGSWLSHLGS